jgi:hypothetical protein
VEKNALKRHLQCHLLHGDGNAGPSSKKEKVNLPLSITCLGERRGEVEE